MRLFPLDSDQDATLMLRHLGAQRQRRLGFRSRRPHLLAQQVSYTPNSSEKGRGEAPTGLGTLRVSGYVRGCPLQVDRLVHISGFGDFLLSQIDAPIDPLPLNSMTARPAKPGKEGDGECRWVSFSLSLLGLRSGGERNGRIRWNVFKFTQDKR